MNQKLTHIFHLSEIQDHKELTQVLLHHFSHASTINTGSYKYQKQGTDHYMIISLNQSEKIENLEISDNFPEEELKVIPN